MLKRTHTDFNENKKNEALGSEKTNESEILDAFSLMLVDAIKNNKDKSEKIAISHHAKINAMVQTF